MAALKCFCRLDRVATFNAPCPTRTCADEAPFTVRARTSRQHCLIVEVSSAASVAVNLDFNLGHSRKKGVVICHHDGEWHIRPCILVPRVNAMRAFALYTMGQCPRAMSNGLGLISFSVWSRLFLQAASSGELVASDPTRIDPRGAARASGAPRRPVSSGLSQSLS